jgi:hypothetical protein
MRKRLVVLAAVLSALSVRAEQKNVKLLTNMTDQELQRTMNMMRASLGVHCDFCHVVDDKDGWQFDKDDKKEKKTAREMIAMTMKLNKESFEGHIDVSCWTCHRGAVRPVSLVSLPQAAPPFPTPKPARPELPTRDEVVKKYTEALGNLALWEKPRALKGVRESFDGKPVPIDIQESGARWHILATLPTGRIEQVVTEEGGWSKDAKGVTPVNAGQLMSFRELSSLMTPPLPSTIPADARVVGKEVIGNVETVIVAYRAPDQTRHRLFFNTTSGLLARHVTTRETPIGLIPQQTDFEQWHDQQGTAFPYTVRTSLVDPWVGSTRKYTSVQLDAKIDEGAFAKPK